MRYKSFQSFLEDNGVDWKLFLENCKYENQNWKERNRFYEEKPEKKFLKDKKWFLFNCFSWNKSLQKNISWPDLDSRLTDVVKENPRLVFDNSKYKVKKIKTF